MVDLNVCIVHSVRLFEVAMGWYRAVQMWSIPLDFRNYSNSALVKLEPLSVIITF